MKYIVKEKYELATYIDDYENVTGGSHISEVSLQVPESLISSDILMGLEKEIKSIIDRLDHATLIYENNRNMEFVKKYSDRVIQVSTPVSRETVSNVIYNTIEGYLEKNPSFKDIKLLSVFTSIDFIDYKVLVDTYKDMSIIYSEPIFNT